VLNAGAKITRFIHTLRDVTAGHLKPAAFEPGSDGTTSIAEISGLAEPVVWQMARLTLGTAPPRDKVVGRADLLAGDAQNHGLRAIRDDLGFTGHGCLEGWGRDPMERRVHWKRIASELCDAAQWVPADPPITA